MRNNHITLPELPKFEAGASTSSSSGPSGTSSGAMTQKTTRSQKQHRPDRACDACRRRKARCDGPSMPERVCSSCKQSGKKCTYVEISRPRGPSKAYVNGLEDKVERLETFLKTICPNVDLNSQLGPPVIRDSWKSDFANSSPSGSRKVSPSSTYAVRSTSQHTGLSSNPANVIDLSSAISFHHHKHSSITESSFGSLSDDEDEEPVGGRPLTLVQEIGLPNIHPLTLAPTHASIDLAFQFTGRSSNYHLASQVRRIKENYIVEARHESAERSEEDDAEMQHADAPIRRQEFWSRPPWELCWEGARDSSSDLLPDLTAALPPADLASDLIDLFFANINLQFPLLHRPIFQRKWDAGLQRQDPWFACLCLSVFAAASRWSDDSRVLPEDDEGLGEDTRRRKAGHTFFEATLPIYQERRNILTPASLFELQSHAILALFLHGTSEMPLAWTRIGIALRKAQALGIHRKRSYRIGTPTLEEEQWKRVFWVLVALDRLGSASLGRPCCVDETDFDLDLPLEVDDDFWENSDPSANFRQPLGRPSLITAFNYFLNLMQVMSFALRTIYAIDRSKLGFGGPPRQEALVMQMNNAMTEWVDSVPEHLRWTPRMQNVIFSTQAATLYTTYYLVQILIYKPFIQRPSVTGKTTRSRSTTLSKFPFPAASICVKAAESCSRILDSQMQRGLGFVPNCIAVAHICGAILAAEIWDLKCREKAMQFEDVKPPSTIIDTLTADLLVFIKALRAIESTWEIAHIFLNQLNECLPNEGAEPGPSQSLQDFDTLFTLPQVAPTPHPFITIHASGLEQSIPSPSDSAPNIGQLFSMQLDTSMHTPYGIPHSTSGALDLNQWFWPTSDLFESHSFHRLSSLTNIGVY